MPLSITSETINISSDLPPIKPPKEKKNLWSKEEDEILRQLVQTHTTGNWTSISELLPGRTGKQCRERWFNHLSDGIKKGDWTEEEDKIITTMRLSVGNQWCKITKMLPGRTDNAVKNRFHAMERAQAKGKLKIPDSYDHEYFLDLISHYPELEFDISTYPHPNIYDPFLPNGYTRHSYYPMNSSNNTENKISDDDIELTDLDLEQLQSFEYKPSPPPQGQQEYQQTMLYYNDIPNIPNQQNTSQYQVQHQSYQSNIQYEQQLYQSNIQYEQQPYINIIKQELNEQHQYQQQQIYYEQPQELHQYQQQQQQIYYEQSPSFQQNTIAPFQQTTIAPFQQDEEYGDFDENGEEAEMMDDLMDLDVISFDEDDMAFDNLQISNKMDESNIGNDACCFGYFDWGNSPFTSGRDYSAPTTGIGINTSGNNNNNSYRAPLNKATNSNETTPTFSPKAAASRSTRSQASQNTITSFFCSS